MVIPIQCIAISAPARATGSPRAAIAALRPPTKNQSSASTSTRPVAALP